MRGGPTKMVIFGHRQGGGGGGGPTPKKSQNYPFLGKIFEFQGGGVRTPGPPLWIRACTSGTGHRFGKPRHTNGVRRELPESEWFTGDTPNQWGCARREISPWLSQEMRTWTHSHQTFQQRRSENQGGHSSP